ncbi:succinate dehydrogenase [Bosea thiooxidans]|uniref:Succinate dehydrogenase cytochrome b556 subunit n=1 Tax=Bosea thiooxidans TaxID=53254 RepID=A0A0Q3KJ93_9HYPH|nr:succinate dehydrogenase [Bosea thiooxidans]SKB45594.1 succinate dehydrogenase subunit C [Bosea thiooxidans]
MAEVKPVARPLSPHLQIYRWSWTMAMSVAHRVTGSGLYLGTVLIAAWLVAAASGPAAFGTAQAIAGSFLGRLVLFLYSFSLIHHMLGGLRHFVWDMGKGYEPETRMKMAKFTLVGSVSLTVLVWIVALVLR